MSSIFGFGKRELKENLLLEAIESIAESLKVLAESKVTEDISDDIAATRKAIESLEQRWGGCREPWRTGPR